MTRLTAIILKVSALELSHRQALDAGAGLVHGPRDESWGRSTRTNFDPGMRL